MSYIRYDFVLCKDMSCDTDSTGWQARQIRLQRMKTAEILGWFYGFTPGSGSAFLQPLYSQKHLGVFPSM